MRRMQAGYEAYSLLHYGVDSHGYVNPVYLTTWGSGMSALYSYLSIPFIALFGLNTFSIRIVQAVSSIFLMVFTYKLVKKTVGVRCALWVMFFLAIMPWRILMSRWGLDCNLAPTFLAAAWYFMVLAVDKSKYIITAFVLYGFSLYCYATLWTLVPVMLTGQLVWMFMYRKIKLDKNFFAASGVLGIMALPLILFLLVQYRVIDEIKTGVLSIPLMPGFRSDDIGFKNWRTNLKNLLEMLDTQNDGLIFNSDVKYGLYYHISEFLLLAGVFVLLFCVCRSVKNHSFDLWMFHFINVCAFFFQTSLIEVNVNRINGIHVLLIVLIASAVDWLIENLQKEYVGMIIGICYTVLFVSFMRYYFRDYSVQIAAVFQKDLGNAIAYAEENASDSELVLSSDVNYAKYLFYSKYPVKKFVESVCYTNYPSPWLAVDSFEGVSFLAEVNEENADKGKWYIWRTQGEDLFLSNGFTVEKFGEWIVAYID